MKMLDFKDYENDNFYRRVYTLDNNIQIDNFLDVVKNFETEQIKMIVCNCQSFNGDGHPLFARYESVDDIALLKDFPSPYIRFFVEFGDHITHDYKFNLEANVNSNVVSYIVDKKKLENNVSKGRKFQ